MKYCRKEDDVFCHTVMTKTKTKTNTQIHKYTNTQIHKYTKTNTQIQTHKYKYKKINKYKYTNTNAQIQIHRPIPHSSHQNYSRQFVQVFSLQNPTYIPQFSTYLPTHKDLTPNPTFIPHKISQQTLSHINPTFQYPT